MPKFAAALGFALLFGLTETLACALLLGDRLEWRHYAGLALLLVSSSCMLALTFAQRQGREDNDRLKLFADSLACAASREEIDEALLRQTRRLLSGRHDPAVVQLDPFEDQISIRSGTLRDPRLADRLRFERQTESLVELRDSLFVRLHGGASPAFLVISKNGPIRLFPIRNRLRALCALAQTAYEKQVLVDGTARELEQALRDQPRTSARLARLAFGLTERERSRLALELHDTALQDQLFWRRRLEKWIEKVPESFSAECLVRPLTEIADGMLDVIEQIREICGDLKPDLNFRNESSPLPEGPETAERILGDLLRKSRLRADFVPILDASSFSRKLDAETWLILYRIVQELLNNAQKHAQARHVRLTLNSEGDRISLIYQDDGIGTSAFVEKERSGSVDGDRSGGMGLNGIRERARGLNGCIQFDSKPNQGFRFELHFLG